MASDLYVFAAQSGQGLCSVDGPLTESGDALPSCQPPPSDVSRVMGKVTSFGNLPDRLSSLNLCLSEKVVDCLRGIPWQNEVVCLSMSIHRKKKVVAEYTAVFARQQLDPVDYHRSRTGWSISGELAHVRDYVLHEALLPDADLFQIRGHEWVVSARVRERIEAAGATGCRFYPVTVTSEPWQPDITIYSHALADRIRRIAAGCGLTEKPMFGGIGFLWQNEFCVAAKAGYLVARIGPLAAREALTQPNVSPFDLGPFFDHDRHPNLAKGWVSIPGETLDDDALKTRLNRSLTFVAAQLRLVNANSPEPTLA